MPLECGMCETGLMGLESNFPTRSVVLQSLVCGVVVVA
uniref:Uncharacterized protein n=1 Tax=Anopheles quadriannulatus TaxID=34691 RepID=A0A182XQJ1_ANOQN